MAKFNIFSELSTERESLLRKQNEMTADIEKLIKHNEVIYFKSFFFRLLVYKINLFFIMLKELFYIRDELKKSGLVLYNKRFLNSNTATKFKNNSNPNLDALNDNQPKPLMFVS